MEWNVNEDLEISRYSDESALNEDVSSFSKSFLASLKNKQKTHDVMLWKPRGKMGAFIPVSKTILLVPQELLPASGPCSSQRHINIDHRDDDECCFFLIYCDLNKCETCAFGYYFLFALTMLANQVPTPCLIILRVCCLSFLLLINGLGQTGF